MSTTTTRIVRLDDGQGVTLGQIVCLVEVVDQEPTYGIPTHERRWNELHPSPRTNQGQRPLWRGWLGTTSGVHRLARGPWRVTSVHPWDETSTGVQRVRVRLVEVEREIPSSDLDSSAHRVEVVREGGSHPWRATCTCGWRAPLAYAYERSAVTIADAHRLGLEP